MCASATFTTTGGQNKVQLLAGYYGGKLRITVPQGLEFEYDLRNVGKGGELTTEEKEQAKLEMVTFLNTLDKDELIDILIGIVEYAEED